jgi:hypothetical protein
VLALHAGANGNVHVLGHESLEDSLSYNSIHLQGVDALRNAFGELPKDDVCSDEMKRQVLSTVGQSSFFFLFS